MLDLVFLIPLLPLAGFTILLLFGRKLGNPWAGWLASTMVLASFGVAIDVFVGLFKRQPDNRSYTQHFFQWLNVGHLHIGVGALVDPLSMTMVAFITGVSALIHFYSIGYMEHDKDFTKFFVYLNLFVFSMLMLVLGDNLLVTFFGWEGVGVCSYFLISFWFERPTAASAGKKAMIYNRIGDGGFLLAIFLVYSRVGSLNYHYIFSHLSRLSPTDMTATGLLLFLAAAGKSAQTPLFPWLADAMEGPTPVSALIHAATMVTAGVYLMCRINPILHLTPDAAHVVAWVGAATAFLGATSACAQQDIKKILAYSTVSQLGFMFMAAGVGAYVAAIFLMLTHAFYKALLFLGAGSVIHAMDDEQDVKKMGGLAKVMPITAVTFAVAWLSIAGVPPFSGFWSKGDVLQNAWVLSPGLWAVGAFSALLTAYYMGREFSLVFLGEARWKKQTGGTAPHDLHPHDPRFVMKFPLVVLAFAATFAGFLNLPFHPDFVFLEKWLNPVVGASLLSHNFSVGADWAFALADAAIAVTGASVAWTLWKSRSDRENLEPGILQKAWGIDNVIDRTFAKTSDKLAAFMTDGVDLKVIDGAVNMFGKLAVSSGRVLRKVQTGYVRMYTLFFAAASIALLAYLMTRVAS